MRMDTISNIFSRYCIVYSVSLRQCLYLLRCIKRRRKPLDSRFTALIFHTKFAKGQTLVLIHFTILCVLGALIRLTILPLLSCHSADRMGLRQNTSTKRSSQLVLLLTLCLLGNFSYFFFVCRFFSKSTFSKNSFRNTISVSNGLDPDQARRFRRA